MQIPSRTKQEYNIEYRKNNKDAIKEKNKIYYLKKILLKKQRINNLEIKNLELDIDALELEFIKSLK